MKMWRESGATNVYVSHLGVSPFGLGRALNERVHLKVIFLYFIALYTNQESWSDKGGC